MDLAMIGLGRMGGDLVGRLMADGHRCVVHDLDTDAVAAAVAAGAVGAPDLAAMTAELRSPRIVWVMVPARVTGSVITQLTAVLEPGDIVIDGGNSNWRDDLDRGVALAEAGIGYLDIGTSGGITGRRQGYCLMVGGEADTVAAVRPILESLAPGIDASPRTPGRDGPADPAEAGWLHCGPTGTGHFVKMVHNGIEYGMMAAIAEGLAVIDGARFAGAGPDGSLDLEAIAEVWRRGSIIESRLLDFTAEALVADPDLATYEGNVPDSGTGRWAAHAAIDLGVPTPVLTTALQQRFTSTGAGVTSAKLLSAMRRTFGGHRET